MMRNPIILAISIFAITIAGTSVSGDSIAMWMNDAPINVTLRAELTALKPAAWAKVDLVELENKLGNYPPPVQQNLRLWIARQLAHASLYDEAATMLTPVDAKQVTDPASLHFYRAVCAYRALDKAKTAEAIDRLLAYESSNKGSVPERYLTVARLMREDIGTIKEASLDHIARQMEDIGRRLDLGRSGQKVQDIEDEVIRSLDKMIEQLEKQQQQQQSSSGGNSTQSSKPADDSNMMGGKGPGLVKRKNIGAKDGWGNLPPKQREEAMQEVGRRFPAHYREIIEQYFRKMAE